MLSKGRAKVGEQLVLRVKAPVPTVIGVDSAFDRWTGGEWTPEFQLFKEWPNGPAGYAPVGTKTLIPDVGLPGDRPWPIVIPKAAKEGRYRIREDVLLEPKTGPAQSVELWVLLEIVA